MRRGKQRKFGREKIQRKAFFKSLATALIDKEKIKTTEARAKSLSTLMNRLVGTALKGDVAARRRLSTLLGPVAVKKLTDTIAPRLKDKKGGYIRITKIGRRKSDGAPMTMIEFTA